MKASELRDAISPFTGIVNKHALSPTYRALRLAPTYIRGCAAYGTMELEMATGLDSETHVDGDAFLQVLRSLPSADLEMRASEGSLHWKCGAARGQLALLGDKIEIPAPAWPEGIEAQKVPDGFARMLELAALGCGSVALLSVGLYGITLSNRSDGLYGYSSDNVTIAAARVGDKIPGPESLTLSPDAVRLAGMLSGRGDLAAAFDADSFYLQTPSTRCVIRQVPALKFNLKDVVSPFLTREVQVELDREVILSFIRRAEALAEERGKTEVNISVSEGAVRLGFSEGKSSSEEYYLAEGVAAAEIAPISIDARRLSRALARASHIVFDQADKAALVLRGESEFAYVISGKKPPQT